jgi:hypothetical protein
LQPHRTRTATVLAATEIAVSQPFYGSRENGFVCSPTRWLGTGSVELVHAAKQRRDQIQGGVNLGFATPKDLGVEVWIAHPDDRVAAHGGRQR